MGPFGNYSKQKKDCYVLLDEKTETRRPVVNGMLYGISRDGIKGPDINVCCIAGKNGASKSTLLDIMFRIINNVA